MAYPKGCKTPYPVWKKEMIEAKEQEMSFMLPNLFTICEGERVKSKTIKFKVKGE